MNIHILVLIIAIALFGVLAFKQMSALILAPLVTIFVILCSGLPILDSLKGLFMPAATDYVTKYFLTFFVGALFGAVYQFTGAAAGMNMFCKPSIIGICEHINTKIVTNGARINALNCLHASNAKRIMAINNTRIPKFIIAIPLLFG